MLPALGLQTTGWLLWLTGTHRGTPGAGRRRTGAGGPGLDVRPVLVAGAGQPLPTACALAVGWAGVFGMLCLLAVLLAQTGGPHRTGLAAVKTGLWGGVVVTFVAVLHRMLPFSHPAHCP